MIEVRSDVHFERNGDIPSPLHTCPLTPLYVYTYLLYSHVRVHSLGQIAHMTHEEECAIDLNSNSYIIDFSAMQQVRSIVLHTVQ